MRGDIVIAGIGHTAYGKLPGRSSVSLNVEACRNALADAGIPKDMVDAVIVKTPTSKRELMYGQKLAEALGIQPRMGCATDQGGAANITNIMLASMAIEAGQCEVALVCFGDNPRSGDRAVYARPRGDDAAYGWFSTAAGYAMIHQRYRHKHKVPLEAFGAVAVAARRHGNANPAAQLHRPLTMEQYLESPFQVDPIRRDDCCLVSDGAAALVLMSAKRAAQLGIEKPVAVLGYGQGQTSWEPYLRPSITDTEAGKAATTAFKMAGVSPEDIDVAQLYDCFTVTVLMTLESYGFCKPGQAANFVKGGALELGGALPFNTSGGLLSESGMPGLQLVLEAVRQIRGTANLQVPNARFAVVSNQGGTMHTHGALILGH